ncbi:MAG: DUF2062 domain-containing protein [Deltaproteobacteria bacterium]|nr:DUF2062 domain-containing protein [Deltaproteobacteria bacterium]MBW1951903.1 DUF2062 domain-containing protein [Deltaproteobacteria bacterium]MBW1986955.1 DUF2062 domain-containing protein [Deltaproteobacteria bacterium]MBW2134470.1 DUF2062 domain-containing protein [Deltaproteobacteria bacterium]
MRWRRRIRFFYLRFRRLQGAPRKLACSVALGVYIGVTPTIPFHMVIALALSSIFRLSRVAAVMGCWISNPLTIPPFYYFSFKVGQLILFSGESFSLPDTFNFLEVLRLGWRINLALQVGGLIIALPVAVIAYFLTYWGIRRYRSRNSRKFNRALRLSQSPVPPSGTEA